MFFLSNFSDLYLARWQSVIFELPWHNGPKLQTNRNLVKFLQIEPMAFVRTRFEICINDCSQVIGRESKNQMEMQTDL